MRRAFALLAACALSLALTGIAGADGPALAGSVGPGFQISLRDASGNAITRLDPGPVVLTVDDLSDEHDFHLQGPGVDVATDVAGTGTTTFQIALVDGRYTFVCDVHPLRMTGSFIVGTPPPAAPPVAPAPPRLVLTVTPKAITLVTAAGRAVRALAPGPYVIVVRDRARTQGARLAGAGVNRSTGIPFVGTVTWKVTFAAGSFVYRSDTGKPKLRGGRVSVVS